MRNLGFLRGERSEGVHPVRGDVVIAGYAYRRVAKTVEHLANRG